MAVQAPVNPKMHPEIDDDDEPLVFRRKNTSSKQIAGKSGKQGSEAHSSNGLNSSTQKNMNASSSSAAVVRSPQATSKVLSSSFKTSSLKVPSSSPNASASSSKTSYSKPPVSSSKPVEGQSKQSLKQIPNAVKEENMVSKQHNESMYDSDDDKPLNHRVKVKSIDENKGRGLSDQLMNEDSDDDKPLSARIPIKTPATGSVNRHIDHGEKKPVAPRAQQSGSLLKNSQLKSSTSSSKRTLDKFTASSSHSSVKKTKLSEQTKLKQVSLKKEVKEEEEDDDDHVPIAQRMKKPSGSDKKPASAKQKAMRPVHSSFKKSVKSKLKKKNSEWRKQSPSSSDGQKKWTTLVHSGVIFPPPYKPHGVKMLYNGRPVDLTPEQEEVATMFAVMKDTDYMEKDTFKKNFWSEWRKILGKNHVIQSLEGCDFTPIYDWAQQEKEKKKQMSKEEKLAIKEAKMKEEEKYMWAIVDGVKEKVGNFRVEPPGLFRGRGEHPKMGMLKKRVHPSDVTINIGKDAPIPESPIPGESWKEIRHDNTVTWLAYWPDTINPKEFKYVFLAASSALKGQSDKEKYEKARALKDYIDNIRVNYTKDFTCRDITKRQIAVATYLIDKLALRAGNEKDDDEADTVGCCTLKVENVTPIPPERLKFDFLGKDSIRYVNEVDVLPPVYKAIEQFRNGKKSGDDLFDKLDTSKLNAHLKELMPGLTAKVFRTFNASYTLQDELAKGIKEAGERDVAGKIAVYNSANKQVAIICNHQRTVSKTHGAQMAKLNEKIEELKGTLNELKTDLARAKKGKPPLKDADGKRKRNLNPEAIEKKIAQTAIKIEKLEQQKEAKEDLKTVALGTSKINYCDPRITVAWCKHNEVPIEKIFQKTLLAKFAWAMDTEPDFIF